MPEFTTNSDTHLPDDIGLPNDIGVMRWMLQSFFKGYVTAMLWANVNWEGDSGDPPDGFSNGDIELTVDQLRELAGDAIDFVNGQAVNLISYVLTRHHDVGGIAKAWEHAGHDFALTRNGHGAGFWDRGLGDLGERLTNACRPYGSLSIDATVEDGEIKTWIQ